MFAIRYIIIRQERKIRQIFGLTPVLKRSFIRKKKLRSLLIILSSLYVFLIADHVSLYIGKTVLINAFTVNDRREFDQAKQKKKTRNIEAYKI